MKKILLSLTCLATTSLTASPLKLDLQQVTVSGLSSGGYMANQLHIAHSDWVSGAGIIAAGPYYCGQNSITTALSQCVNKQDTPIDLAVLSAQAKTWQDQGKIASLDNLKHDKVWLLHGSKDQRVIAPVNQALYQQYNQWINPQNIRFIQDKAFAHHFPTLAQGASCDSSEAPFLGKCHYDAAGEMLKHLLGKLDNRSDNPKGQLLEVDQQQLGGDAAKSLADKAYAYVPDSCAAGQTCQLHVNFHGCNQFADAIGQQYVANNGLNNWADTNQLVILYPQTKKSMFMPLNPQGCWDWWGYTGADYATQKGQQVQAVVNMSKALQGLEVNNGE